MTKDEKAVVAEVVEALDQFSVAETEVIMSGEVDERVGRVPPVPIKQRVREAALKRRDAYFGLTRKLNPLIRD